MSGDHQVNLNLSLTLVDVKLVLSTFSPPSPGIRMMGDLTPSLSGENNVPEVEDITDTNNTAVALTLILSP